MEIAAVGLYELFESYINAGFTRKEAMEIILVIVQMNAMPRERPKDD